jgi:hypothetical protein
MLRADQLPRNTSLDYRETQEYHKQLQTIGGKILSTHMAGKNSTSVTIPLTSPLPFYNYKKCIIYVIGELRYYGYTALLHESNEILISWNLRNKINKKQNIDEKIEREMQFAKKKLKSTSPTPDSDYTSDSDD